MKAKKAVKRGMKAGTSKAAVAARKIQFKAEYLRNGGNGYQAAITVGYKAGKSAEKIATKWCGEEGFGAALAEKAESIADKAGMSVERTLREIARLAFSDVRKFYDKAGNLIPVHQLDDETAACIASVEVDEIRAGEDGVIGHTKKIKHWDKNSALEKAMKYHGLYDKDNSQRQPQVVIVATALDERL